MEDNKEITFKDTIKIVQKSPLNNQDSETIYSLFIKSVKTHTNEHAIIENNKTMTFGELSLLVDEISNCLPKDIKSVGVVMNHGSKMIACILAILKLGAMYIPAEPSFPRRRIKYMMEESKVDFILTENEYIDILVGLPIKIIDKEVPKSEPLAEENIEKQNPNSPAYVLYTSGTTGRPKGICATNQNVCHYVHAFAYEFHPTSGDVMLQYSVCTFDIFVEEVFTSLLNGVALAIPTEKDKENIRTLMDFVKKYKVTIISGFPYLLAEMNHLTELPSSLRLLISGGDVLRGIYINNLLKKTQVYNTYGPSETTVCASYYNCNNGEVLKDGTYPIGHPVKGNIIRILDQAGKEVPKGEIGEICIYGKGVTLGYIGNHNEENRAFEHFPNGDIMYRSGDLGYILPSGDIAFLHRKDTQIMIYGKRVEVMEVESILYQCKGIEQAVVRAFSDENKLFYMIAYIVPSDNNIKLSEIHKELSESLASFMIPEFFVKIPKIPLNTNGKPDLSQLPVVLKS